MLLRFHTSPAILLALFTVHARAVGAPTSLSNLSHFCLCVRTPIALYHCTLTTCGSMRARVLRCVDVPLDLFVVFSRMTGDLSCFCWVQGVEGALSVPLDPFVVFRVRLIHIHQHGHRAHFHQMRPGVFVFSDRRNDARTELQQGLRQRRLLKFSNVNESVYLL